MPKTKPHQLMNYRLVLGFARFAKQAMKSSVGISLRTNNAFRSTIFAT